jgi:pimeloyl-ACP methyl ester carboxylesterase
MSGSIAPIIEDRLRVSAGIDIHYCAWGDESLPVLFLVHGANSHLRSWEPVASELADSYRVVCPDLRGHGESGWASGGYRVADFTRDLHDLARALDVGPFDFVGHSLGGRIGIAYAAKHREDIKHLILSDIGPEAPKEAALFARKSAAHGLVGGREIRGFSTLEEVEAYYEAAYPGWQREFYRLQAHHAVRLNWAGKWVFRADPDLFWINGSAGVRDNEYLWEQEKLISCPTLILWACGQSFLDSAIVTRMLGDIQGATVVRCDTGHYIYREDPATFVREVRTFLER